MDDVGERGAQPLSQRSNRAVARPACRNIDVDALYKNPTVGRSLAHTRPRGVVSNGSAGNRMTIIPASTRADSVQPFFSFFGRPGPRERHGQILQRPFVLIYGGFGETRIAAATAAASGTKCCERARASYSIKFYGRAKLFFATSFPADALKVTLSAI